MAGLPRPAVHPRIAQPQQVRHRGFSVSISSPRSPFPHETPRDPTRAKDPYGAGNYRPMDEPPVTSVPPPTMDRPVDVETILAVGCYQSDAMDWMPTDHRNLGAVEPVMGKCLEWDACPAMDQASVGSCPLHACHPLDRAMCRIGPCAGRMNQPLPA